MKREEEGKAGRKEENEGMSHVSDGKEGKRIAFKSSSVWHHLQHMASSMPV